MDRSPRGLAVPAIADPRRQRTHQLDLAGPAMAHATRTALSRQDDVEVPHRAPGGGLRVVRLWRDGDPCLAWTLDGDVCRSPEPSASASWRGGFLRWADATLPVDDAEAAMVLRRACGIGLGGGADLEAYPRASDLAHVTAGLCCPFQPVVAARAWREPATIRDRDARVDEMLAAGPDAPGPALRTERRSAAPGGDPTQ